MKRLFKTLLSSSPDPALMRLRQFLLMAGLVGAGAGVTLLLMSSFSAVVQEEPRAAEKVKAKIETPFNTADTRDIWVNRVEKEAESAKKEAKAVREETTLLQKRLDVMDQLFQGMKEGEKPSPPEATLSQGLPSLESAPPSSSVPLKTSSSVSFPAASAWHQNPGETQEDREFSGERPSGSRILLLSAKGQSRPLLKNVDTYMPAGTYARAVLTSGVVASTSLQASARPQPILMRLADEGHLPRGFSGTMKDAVLIGACYGDLSSERVMCRLETLSWVEKDGTTVEKKVGGWVIGEDGRPGLRGEVVDRAGEVARESLMAGILSGMSQFLKFEATASVYPITPFGQTNALKPKDALQGAAGSGVGNALDKLAEFSIKRAEQMQPVILIASGRVVDVVFEKGVDLRPESMTPSLTLVGQNPSTAETSHDSTH